MENEELNKEQKISLARKIAAYIVAQVILHQEENNYVVDSRQIEKEFGLKVSLIYDNELVGNIERELFKYPQFEGNGDAVWLEYDNDNNLVEFNCLAFTDYIAYQED